MASKIFTTQNWRIICDTQEDQSTAAALTILAQDCKGNLSTFSATLDSDTNRIFYDVAVNEVTTVGDWMFWPRTTIAGNIAPGDPALVKIFAEGT